MRVPIVVIAWALMPAIVATTARADVREETIQFRKGESRATVKGTIKGDQTADYKLRASAGQTLTVDFKPNSRSAYFNVLPPGGEQALFVGATSGNRYVGTLPADGLYTIRVYLMRSAARRNEIARYTLDVGVTGATRDTDTAQATRAVAGPSGPFDQTLELQGIRFRVVSANEGSINTLRIVPSGLEIVNRPIEQEIDGTVTAAEVADINADGSPEIYVYVTSAGSGSYGSLVAYAANRRKSLSQIYLPPLADNKTASQGYMGHDEFAIVEGTLVQRFPLYRDGDPNNRPTGGTRQLQYKLVPGEAGWILKLDRTVDY